MQFSTTYKKWTKYLLLLLITSVVVGAAFYFIVAHQFKLVVQTILNKESKGLYKLNIKSIDISIWNKDIIVKNAEIICTDTTHITPRYEVLVPKTYLAIQSWTELILNRKLLVDSLVIESPTIKVYENSQHKISGVSTFQVTDIMDHLKTTLVYFNLRSLVLKDGSFTYIKANTSTPFICNHVNLSVSNFTKENNNSDHLFASDDVDLSINNQYWQLPDGLHTINFKRLHFSGKSKFFELDSCVIHKKADGEKGEVTLSADKIFFNSAQLPAIYEKQELLIDTLICIKPILNLPNDIKDSTKDIVKNIKKSAAFLFNYIHFKYINVIEGELLYNSINRSTYSTQKANFQAYNLAINPDSTSKIYADSILFNLKDLKFITKDSMNQLAVDEFLFKNNDVIFTKAIYGPTPQNKSTKGLTFSTPSLYLKNISLDALLQKRIKASAAFLYDPIFDLSTNKKIKSNKKNTNIGIDTINRFYKTLHDLTELIDVENFHVTNGTVHVAFGGTIPVNMFMKNVNADILLNHFFLSDSLVDIKKSIPTLSIGKINLQSDNMELDINNFAFIGTNKHNYASDFQLSFNNGTEIKGKQLAWNILNWNQFENFRKIIIDHVQVNELIINSIKDKIPVNKKPLKTLPYIHIDSMDVVNLRVTKTSQKTNFNFLGSAIKVDNVNTENNYFTWNNAKGILSNVKYTNANIDVAVANANFNNKNSTIIKDATVEIKNDSGFVKINLPKLTVKANIHSTDFSADKFTSFKIDNPIIKIYTIASITKSKNSFFIPFDFDLDNLNVNNATVYYANETLKDSIYLTTKIDLNASRIQGKKGSNSLLSYDKINANLFYFVLNHNKLIATTPLLKITLSDGQLSNNSTNKFSFLSNTFVEWTDISINYKKSDSTYLLLNHLDGSFNDEHFTFKDFATTQLPSILNKTIIEDGNIFLKEKNETLDIHGLSWQKSKNIIHVDKFSLQPNLSMEKSFIKAKNQADYLMINGKDISATFIPQFYDTFIYLKKIVFNDISISTTRDRRIPFVHGIEKLMPTKLINTIKIPFTIDTAIIQNSTVTINEIAAKTQQMGTIVLRNLNGSITNISNRNNKNKSLVLNANATLFNSKINNLYYSEAYTDPVSPFKMSVNISGINLAELSQITKPLLAVSIEKGYADTLFANWKGNKYFALGDMNFNYHDFKIKLLNLDSTKRKSAVLSIKNIFSGAFIHKENKTPSVIYYERDNEKFIFNYWFKALMTGIESSIGIKKDKKYLKAYKKFGK